MSTLVIGQSSFLAKSLQDNGTTQKWQFLGHKDALTPENWPKDIKTVINCAYDPKIRDGETSDFDLNLAQIAQNREAAYIMLSSRAVYGVPPEPSTLTEEHPTFETILPYGHAKKKIEHELLSKFGNVTVLRLSNIFGFEYSATKPRNTFFGIMLKNLKEKDTIGFNMSPMTQRDFLPANVFCDHLAIIADSPKAGIYNLGAGFGTAVSDIANHVIEGYGQGSLNTPEGKIIDSFVLDMSKTNAAYHLGTINHEDIYKACFEIGQKLKDT